METSAKYLPTVEKAATRAPFDDFQDVLRAARLLRHKKSLRRTKPILLQTKNCHFGAIIYKSFALFRLLSTFIIKLRAASARFKWCAIDLSAAVCVDTASETP